jgi:alkylated DNA repair dioxygenase AlkB
MIKKIFTEPNGEQSIFIYMPKLFCNQKANDIHSWLNKKEYREAYTHWNDSCIREQLWIQEEQKYFCKSWSKKYHRWESDKYDNTLENLQNEIQKSIDQLDIYNETIRKPEINSVLINRYRSENDTIKAHRDTPITFGEYPTIVGLSIGDTRKLCVKKLIYDSNNPNLFVYDNDNTDENFDIQLENGSLFIMAGASQKYFSHEVPKEDHKCSERFSLTFREVI